MDCITIEVEFGTPLYDQMIRLRYDILREPLGLEFTEDQLSREWEDFHLGIFKEGFELIGCLVMQPLQDNCIKMRQVAIDPDYQGKGYGKKLVKYAEQFCREKGYKEIQLNARDTAIPFYEKLSYHKKGDQFIEVGIPHFKMIKSL